MHQLLTFLLLIITLQVSASENSFYVKSDGAELFCREFGQGDLLIVLHGGPGLTQDYLLPQMTELAKDHRVIFYDQRGCGQSKGVTTPESLTIDTYISDLEAIRKACGVETCTILGHSWGGFVAMQYATHYPKMLDKLILSNSMPSTSEDVLLFLQEWIKRTASIKEQLDEIKQSEAFKTGDPKTVEDYYRIVFHTYCYNPKSADLLNLSMSKEASINGSFVNRHFNETIFKNPYDLREDLSKLQIPTLVIHGDYDPIPVGTAENIPHTKLVILKDCGHFPYVEDPKPYFKAIQAFLDD